MSHDPYAGFRRAVMDAAETIAPLPVLPREAAKAGLSALLLAIGTGPSLATDPHGELKMNNFDRLVFDRMPVLCTGPGPLTVGRLPWEPPPLTLREMER